MSVWDALAAGTQSFQRGVNWTGQTVNQINQLREADELNRVNQIESATRRDMQNAQPQVQSFQGATPGQAATPVVTGQPSATQAWQGNETGTAQPVTEAAPAAYAPQPTAPQETLPTPPVPPGTPGEISDEDRIRSGLAAHTAAWNGGPLSATGQPTLDQNYVRDTLTGQGSMAPAALMAGMRHASGNRDQPLGPRDLATYMAEGERRLVAAGLGHRADAWRARVMQNIQSAAHRTAAVAAAQAEGGDLMGASRTLATAYGFIPDGFDVQVSQGPNGEPIAQRVGPGGQALGQPMVMNPQRIRDMAIGVADPGAMETLILQREDRAFHRAQLAETTRHNMATEANARARAAGAGGRTSATTPPSLSDQRAATELVDPHVDPAMAEFQPQGRGRTVDRGAVQAAAADLMLTGATDRRTAARMAAAAFSGRDGAVRYTWARTADGGSVPVGALPGGRPIPLSGAMASIAENVIGPPPQYAAPTTRTPGVRRNQTGVQPVQRPAPTE